MHLNGHQNKRQMYSDLMTGELAQGVAAGVQQELLLVGIANKTEAAHPSNYSD